MSVLKTKNNLNIIQYKEENSKVCTSTLFHKQCFTQNGIHFDRFY